MNPTQQDNENLTLDFDIDLDTLPGMLGNTPIPKGLTLKLEERKLARIHRKKHRKPYTRKRGTVHPNKKKATRRRLLKKQWAERPHSCVIHGWGCYRIPKSEWERVLGPIWAKYNPAKLVVKRDKKAGTKKEPHTIYTLRVYHDGALVYDGNNQLIYDLSGGVQEATV